MKKEPEPTIALVYDKVNTKYGGAEWVLLALHEAFPDAPLFTSIYDKKTAKWAKNFKVISSFLQKIPIKKHAFLVWLFPLAFESLDLKNFDVIISVTSGEAKGVLTKPNQVHISYMLTPPRYLYTHSQRYQSRFPLLQLPIFSHFYGMLTNYLRWWDRAATFRADTHIAISSTVQKRISALYHIESDIVYPPTPNTQQPKTLLFQNTTSFLLSLSRLVAYKRIDLSIKAALQLQRTLIVAGQGEELNRLVALAGKQARLRTSEQLSTFLETFTKQPGLILFVGHVSNTERVSLLAAATALLMPGLEDFGLTALEAASLGTPTILHAKSGASEVLQHSKSAIHISEETTEQLIQAIKLMDTTSLSPTVLRAQAEKCSAKVFTRKMKEYVYDSIIQLNKN